MKLGTSLRSSPLVGHGSTCIEEDVASQVGFFLVFADVESIGFSVDLPVEVADFIPGDVLPVLLELYAKPLVRRSVQTGTKSFNDSFGQNLMVGESRKIFRVEVVGYGGHWVRDLFCKRVELPTLRSLLFLGRP